MDQRHRQPCAGSGCLLLGTCLSPCPVWAVDFIVSNNSDSGAGSLRQAIIDLNTTGGASNNIIVNSGVGTITLTSGDLQTVARNVTIVGNNNTLSGNNRSAACSSAPSRARPRQRSRSPSRTYHHQCTGARRQRYKRWRRRRRSGRRDVCRQSGHPHRQQCHPDRATPRSAATAAAAAVRAAAAAWAATAAAGGRRRRTRGGATGGNNTTAGSAGIAAGGSSGGTGGTRRRRRHGRRRQWRRWRRRRARPRWRQRGGRRRRRRERSRWRRQWRSRRLRRRRRCERRRRGPGGAGGFGGGGGTAALPAGQAASAAAAAAPVAPSRRRWLRRWHGAALACQCGGGGAGLGGAVFVQQGGTLNIAGAFNVSGSTVTGGHRRWRRRRRPARPSASGMFLQGNGTVNFAPGSGVIQTISNVIADQTGSGGTGGNAGSWRLAKSRRRHAGAARRPTPSPAAPPSPAAWSNFAAANNFGSGQRHPQRRRPAMGHRQHGRHIRVSLPRSGAGGGTFDTNGNNVSFATALGGTGGLTKAGSGTLTLSAPTTIPAPRRMNAGTLQLAGGASLGRRRARHQRRHLRYHRQRQRLARSSGTGGAINLASGIADGQQQREHRHWRRRSPARAASPRRATAR